MSAEAKELCPKHGIPLAKATAWAEDNSEVSVMVCLDCQRNNTMPSHLFDLLKSLGFEDPLPMLDTHPQVGRMKGFIDFQRDQIDRARLLLTLAVKDLPEGCKTHKAILAVLREYEHRMDLNPPKLNG